MTRERSDSAIPTGRLLVGILLHLCVPAYLLLCLATALLVEPAVTRWAELPARMLWTAAWFVPALFVAIAAAAALGGALDRRRPRASDPAAVSRAQVAGAAHALAGLGDARLDRALARMAGERWDHRDPRYQRIAADLEAAARTFAAAAKSGDRTTVLDLAAGSAERLAAALDVLEEERRRLDEGDARTVAGYIDARYR